MCGAFPLETSSSLLQMASEHILHMQKSLSQMNLQIHHVLSDLTGASGKRFWMRFWQVSEIRSTGQLCNCRVKSPEKK